MRRGAARRRLREERGTAAVELVCALPFLLSSVLVGGQLVAFTTVGTQAQEAARVAALGTGQDGGRSERALAALPAGLRAEAVVETERDGRAVTVTVTVPVPALVGWLPASLAEASRSATGPAA